MGAALAVLGAHDASMTMRQKTDKPVVVTECLFMSRTCQHMESWAVILAHCCHDLLQAVHYQLKCSPNDGNSTAAKEAALAELWLGCVRSHTQQAFFIYVFAKIVIFCCRLHTASGDVLPNAGVPNCSHGSGAG